MINYFPQKKKIKCRDKIHVRTQKNCTTLVTTATKLTLLKIPETTSECMFSGVYKTLSKQTIC